jgi:hypothetical protein
MCATGIGSPMRASVAATTCGAVQFDDQDRDSAGRIAAPDGGLAA